MLNKETCAIRPNGPPRNTLRYCNAGEARALGSVDVLEQMKQFAKGYLDAIGEGLLPFCFIGNSRNFIYIYKQLFKFKYILSIYEQQLCLQFL